MLRKMMTNNATRKDEESSQHKCVLMSSLNENEDMMWYSAKRHSFRRRLYGRVSHIFRHTFIRKIESSISIYWSTPFACHCCDMGSVSSQSCNFLYAKATTLHALCEETTNAGESIYECFVSCAKGSSSQVVSPSQTCAVFYASHTEHTVALTVEDCVLSI